MFNLVRVTLGFAAFGILLISSSAVWASPDRVTNQHPKDQTIDTVLLNAGLNHRSRVEGNSDKYGALTEEAPLIEPASMFVLGTGLIGAAGIGRRFLRKG